ncbi:SURF1 family protein [Mycobacterium avium subsp. hominissuis]|uniref:SURF1-like protein n=1 Tax=Mycobacterium avium subsp. hominissuis TaxID=439334 RepID=A0A2A3L463_MYCAV|nr:SURF1 family protein [Mycobacterium avium]ETZ41927.1 SURF1 family protein [Mycobacterium avium MAV_120709_2344]APA75573.1 SURF1 family protein [Mycobacterium avium subsp. hominissuis]MCA4733877.1 SURF1 family protein [Mycobacterium avium subsp. hominissuis]MCA4739312.1 SURF1 family protein [Mycobacterium avium subsp. hominissuis]MCA4744613.1 SURF1 family protein [Mycobacterium avium subsp. hominissuis]
MSRWLRGLSFLLRPGWVVLALVVVAFAYLCFTVLAPWQLGKHSRTSQQNHQIEHSLTTPPVPLKTLLPQQNSAAPAEQWRQVSATGHYLADVQVLARLRVIDSKPAFEVLAPFVVDGGPTVLVDRGYVRPLEGSRVPPIPRPPADTVTITARLRNSEPAAAGKDPFVGDGVRQVYSIDTEQIAVLTKVPLAGSYLQLVDGQPGGLGVVGVPQLDAGPFLSYGIQWIAFGILAPIGVGYFAYSELRARRAEKQPAAPAAEAPQSVQDKLADRYGRRR